MFLIFSVLHHILVRSSGVMREEKGRKEGNKCKYTLRVLIKIYLIQLQNSI